jgi:hypothetical protein
VVASNAFFLHIEDKSNLIQSKSLMEMLESSIKRYHNKIITAVEVIDVTLILVISVYPNSFMKFLK